MAKRVGELQALSRVVSFSSSGACVTYVPEFVVKTESALNPLPRSLMVQSLNDFVAGLDEELLLCPVHALREYLKRTASFADRPLRLFISPRSPSRAMTKSGISFFCSVRWFSSLELVVRRAHPFEHTVFVVLLPPPLSSRIGPSLVFWLWLPGVLTLFSSRFILKICNFYEGLRSLGPFVVAGERIG